MNTYHYLDGDIVKETDARIPVRDIALGRGYGVFDYFQIIEGRPLHMQQHLERFRRSANHLRLQVDIDDEIKQVIKQLMEINNRDSAGIKLLATGGISPNGFDIAQGSLAVIMMPFHSVPEKDVEEGVRLLAYEHQRLLPHIKSINYLYAVYLSKELKDAGAIEPLYYTRESVRETARANVMAVKDGRIITCSDKILEGITRKTIIEDLELDVQQRNIPLEELLDADEVFICGTTKRALGVVKIDNHIIGDGKPGPVTMEVRTRLLQMENALV